MKTLLLPILLVASAFAQDEITITIANKAQTFTLKPALVTALQTLISAEKAADGSAKYQDVADFLIKELNRGPFEYAAALYPDPVVKAKQDAVTAAVADAKATTESAVKVEAKQP